MPEDVNIYASEHPLYLPEFHRITMKVLTMQLNSITVMDLIAYGGAALGVILASSQFRAGAAAVNLPWRQS